MKMQEFDFEAYEPPRLSEDQLRAELERRSLKRRLMWLRVAGVVMIICLVLFALSVAQYSMTFAVLSAVTACLMTISHCMLSVFYFRKESVRS